AVSPSVFAVGAGATAKSAAKRPAKGTTFRYSLSHAARVTIAIAQKLTGHRKGHVCVKSGKGKRCTLFVTAESLTRSSASGANSLKFSGRIGRRALKPGTYKATIVAVDAAGQRSAPRSVTFRIVKA